MLHVYLSVNQLACEKLLEVVSGLVPPGQMPTKNPDDHIRVKSKTKKGKMTILKSLVMMEYSLIHNWWTIFRVCRERSEIASLQQ